jgi:hypothetical protein
MLTRARETWAAMTRLVLCALVVPLALSSALPVFARTLGGPPVHVCHCAVRGGHSTCACRICHPERDDLRFSEESIRGTCGDEDFAYGGPTGLAWAVPVASAVRILPAPVSRSLAELPTERVPVVPPDPPTPPPRVAAA